MVSVPWVITTPSASDSEVTAARIRSQSASVSIEESTAIRSTTCTSRPEVRSAPERVGRFTPWSSALVAMVPPVVTTTRFAMGGILAHSRFGMMGE